MGNASVAERLGLDVAHVVQKEKYRLYYAEYKIKGKRDIMEDYSKVLLNFAEKHFKGLQVPQPLPEGPHVIHRPRAFYLGSRRS